MSKKFTFISTLILLTSSLASLSFTTAPPVQAAIQHDDKTYWTFNDMERFAEEVENGSEVADGFWSFTEILDFEKQLNAAAIESCGESVTCEMEYLHEQFLANPDDYRYSLVEQLKMNNFLVTAFNPARGTITIYYNDEDYMEWQITNERVHIYLKDLYLAWTEEDYVDPMDEFVAFNDGMMDRTEPSFVADANNGISREGTHLIFAHTASDGNPLDSWLKNDEEITLNIANSNLRNNTSNKLYYAAYPNGAPSFVGAIDYSEFSSQYKPGMTYQLMYDKKTTYPHWVPQGEADPEEENVAPECEALVPDDESSINDFSSETNISNPVSRVISSEINNSDTTLKAVAVADSILKAADATSEFGATIIGTLEDNNVENASSSAGANSIEAPLALGEKKEAEFPWWIIAFIFSGIVLIFWWFIPIKRRKEEEEE